VNASTSFNIVFAPALSEWLLWTLGAVALVLLGYSLWRRARGALMRALSFAIILLALANPLIVRESHEGLADVVALVIDRSQSQQIGTRSKDAEAALAAMRQKLNALPNLEIREAEVRTQTTAGEGGGTALFGALDQALSDVPPDRVAGAIVITDGEVHDAPAKEKFKLGAPLHVLLTGAPGERDRKLTIVRAERFTIVGQEASITLRVDDFGGAPGGTTDVAISIDGQDRGSQQVTLGQEETIKVPVSHGGENVVEISASAGPSEQTLQNNRAVAVINGVRDRLRVLLVSGEPHAGERVWRNLLKADPSVDLVHFTILRPPDKQDSTPLDELSLIAFPTRQLFAEKLENFDLVIFDRFSNRGILPQAYFENLARYVENGGGLLISAGPEFAKSDSISRTPLASVLPASPTGQTFEKAFRPAVTEDGEAHPVTSALPGSKGSNGTPEWGEWFRSVGAQRLSGTTLMQTPDGQPLLVLDRVKKGRVAELLSDQTWLWARGFEGGGPQAELLRRLAHWLMKEPDLEEERLQARAGDGELVIDRRTMAKTAAPVTVTTPTGKTETVPLTSKQPGVFTAQIKADELGLYRLSDGTLSAVAAAGPLNPKEVADMRATDAILKPFAEASGGAIDWIKDGLPDVRDVKTGERAKGDGWIGLTRRGASRVTSVESTPLMPEWLALVVILGVVVFAWRREAR
jgi:hypothetical protein